MVRNGPTSVWKSVLHWVHLCSGGVLASMSEASFAWGDVCSLRKVISLLVTHNL